MTLELIGAWTGLIGGIAGIAALVLQWLDHRARAAEDRLVMELTREDFRSTSPEGIVPVRVVLINRRKVTVDWTLLRVASPRAKIWRFSSSISGHITYRIEVDSFNPQTALSAGDWNEEKVGIAAPKGARVLVIEAVGVDRETGGRLRVRGRVRL